MTIPYEGEILFYWLLTFTEPSKIPPLSKRATCLCASILPPLYDSQRFDPSYWPPYVSRSNSILSYPISSNPKMTYQHRRRGKVKWHTVRKYAESADANWDHTDHTAFCLKLKFLSMRKTLGGFVEPLPFMC